MVDTKKIYMAPMEGVTGFIYRNTFARFFGGIDKYYTPFISPGEHRSFKSRELKDVLPDNNAGLNVAVQMLTNNAEHFIVTARKMMDFGYREVNLNLGCPSGTVVAKGKGSGFLSFPEKLDAFLDEIYSGLADTGLDISVKTRIGRYEQDEFYELLDIYNKYPISELIIHPRVQKDMYRNTPRMEIFDYAVEHSKNPLVYNGDICTVEDYERFAGHYLKNAENIPDEPKSDKERNNKERNNKESDKKSANITAVMLGRGLISNPGLAGQIVSGSCTDRSCTDRSTLRNFFDELVLAYREEIPDEKNVVFKIKENLFYLVNLFEDKEEYWKKIRKSDNLMELAAIARRMIVDGEFYRKKD
jgi:tRNA-dihydrouridine synthase